MIDQPLIDSNSISLADALKNGSVALPQVRFLKNVFTQNMLLKLQEYFNNNFHSNLWKPETTEYGKPMKNMPRHKIEWESETVVEEIHETCKSATVLLQELHKDSKIIFDGITLWRDQQGYTIPWHTDNPIIQMSMQIYLFGSDACPGTEFKTETGSVTTPFVSNCGYFIDQRAVKPVHRAAYDVPKNQLRYSLFSIWKTIL